MEGQVTSNRMLDRVTEIAIDEHAHGPRGAHNHEYEPTFPLRCLRDLHIRFATS